MAEIYKDIVDHARRMALPAVAFGGMTLGIACGGSADNPKSLSTVPNLAPVAGEQFLPPIDQGAIDLNFPDIHASGLKLSEVEGIQTPTKIPTRIFNYTQYQLQKGAISNIYFEIDNLANRMNLNGYRLEYDDESQGTTLLLQNRQNNVRRTVILPANSTLPIMSALGAPTYAPAFTKASFTEANTLLRATGVYDIPSVRESASILMATEACQQDYFVVPFDKDGKTSHNLNVIKNAQEYICNSVGLAVGFAINGKPYSEYMRILNTFYFPVFKDGFPSNKGIRMIQMPEDAYNSTAKSGPVLK